MANELASIKRLLRTSPEDPSIIQEQDWDGLLTVLQAALDDRATTSALAALLALKAPLASPALTGVPSAPTAPLGTNTSQIATMAAVKAAIDALVAGAPGALDTLDELAAALADNADFAGSMTTLLAAKAPLASPALTGTPTAPTVGGTTDNTTKIATTAFVQAVIAALATPVLSKSYISSQQTITAGGTLTLAHGMGIAPKFVTASLVCTTASQGFTVGQEFALEVGAQAPDMRGVNVIFDATNLTVRFGSEPTVSITALNPTSGILVALTNANFRLILRAFA